jgi:hypothetical protein
MNEDKLLVSLESNLNYALTSESCGDADSGVAKTAKNENDLDCSISKSDNWKDAQQFFESILSSALSYDVNTPPHNTVRTFSTVMVLKTPLP